MGTKILIIIILCTGQSFGQKLSILSWNIKDFGQSRDDAEIILIAQELRNADIVAIQEVVAKHPGGVQAVARLTDQLNRMGAIWDYAYTDPTGDLSSQKKERYAFLWKSSKVKITNRVQLISELDHAVCREPAIAKFEVNGHNITILNYHACTHTKAYPERKEIYSITQWLNKSNLENVIWCGDMNLEIDDKGFFSVFQAGLQSALHGEKTSLKKSCQDGIYKNRAEDNILYKLNQLRLISSKVLDFVNEDNCKEVEWKWISYSDHLPIQITIKE